VDDIINQRQVQQDSPAQPKRGRWLRRFLLGFLLFFAIGACAFFWLTHNTRSQPPYSTALELIQNDAQLIEHIGQPIRDLRWLPTSGYPKQFQMQVDGPKGLADISVSAGEFEGKWELTAIDVFIREGSQRFSLSTGSGAGDAPTWSPAGATPDGGDSGDLGLEPPAGIHIELPEMPSIPRAPGS